MEMMWEEKRNWSGDVNAGMGKGGNGKLEPISAHI